MIKEMLTETVVSSSDTQINNELCHESFFSTKNFQAKKNIYYSLSNFMNFMIVNSKIKSKNGHIYNKQAAKVSTEEVYRTTSRNKLYHQLWRFLTSCVPASCIFLV
jgi:hypothetical protein